MKKLLAVLKKVLHPPKLVLLIVSAVVFSALILIFLTERLNSAAAYPIFVLSAYCLTILLLPLPKLIRNAKTRITLRISRVPFVRRYMDDISFRGSVGIYQGAAVNFFYVVFRIYAGIRYASMWFISMAVYYLALGLIRLSLILSRRCHASEALCYRRTAWLLFALNIPMGGMILQMVMNNSELSYPGHVIYLTAMYTFYTMAMSVVNLVRYRRLGSPVLSAAKVLNFVSALMSVLCLQTAMIAQFSENDYVFRRLMNTITGGIVWTGVILTAAYMLYRSRNAKDEVKSDEQIRE